MIQIFSQTPKVEWRVLPIERLPPERRPLFHQMMCSPTGSLILSSTHGLIDFQGFRINFPSVGLIAKEKEKIGKVKDPHTEGGIKAICRGEGTNFFIVTAEDQIYYMDENLLTLTGWSNPPLYIPVNISKGKKISSIWADDDGDLYIGTNGDSLIIIPGIAKHPPADGEIDKEGNFVSKKAVAKSKKIYIENNPEIFSIINNTINGGIFIATSKGIIRFEKEKGTTKFLGKNWNPQTIITSILAEPNGNIWFGTSEQGIGLYNSKLDEYFFYKGDSKKMSVSSFCRKSENEFFVAVTDSLPAIFNTSDNRFTFLADSIFTSFGIRSTFFADSNFNQIKKNQTTDIKVNGFGNVFVIKGGALFYTNSFNIDKDYFGVSLPETAYAPFIYDIKINQRPYYEVLKLGNPLANLDEIVLEHDHNNIEFSCSLLEFWNQRKTEMQWKVDGLVMSWFSTTPEGDERFKAKFIPSLKPGKYVFRARARVDNGPWRTQAAALTIIIKPPFWQTRWFWIVVIGSAIAIILFFYIRYVLIKKQKEKEKAIHEKELVELEAKALRAQMNPHFVFNSLNSIKSLINKNENDTAANYLTTFSKLIRSLFQNSDKREVSLKEELETSQLYTQLEKMRFGEKVEFVFDIDESIDLKDFKVPALILQPFIENAIWHGLMPKEKGGRVTISVKRSNGSIQCIIEDNGIGREQSKKFKPQYETSHESRGIGLTQSRLELDKLLNEREDNIFIIDKEDENGKPEGTKVVITFKENGN
jgi:two-component sensor histidine kinase